MRDMAERLDTRADRVKELTLSLYRLEAYLEVGRGAEARREYKAVLEILIPLCVEDMDTLRGRAEKSDYFPRAHEVVAAFRAGMKPDGLLTDVMSMVIGLDRGLWYAGA